MATYIPPGFDATKWNDPNYHSVKYDTGRSLQQFGASTPAQIQQAVDAVRKAYPTYNLTYGGQGDRVTVDGRPIDVSNSFNTGRGTLQWGDWTAGPGGSAPSGPGAAGLRAPSIPGQPTAAEFTHNVQAVHGLPPDVLQRVAALTEQLWAARNAHAPAQVTQAYETSINDIVNRALQSVMAI